MLSTQNGVTKHKICLILSGELRFESENAIYDFKTLFSNTVLYISTYPRYKRIANILSAHVVFTEDIPQDIPHAAANQFYLLEKCLASFDFTQFEYIGRIRTDATYECNFTLSHFPANDTVYMETDICYYAKGHTFIRVFQNIWSDMVRKRYYNCKNEGRTMLPNFQNILKSDLSNHGRGGWITRWMWLDNPKSCFPKATAFYTENEYREYIKVLQENLPTLMTMYQSQSQVPTVLLTDLAPVPEFCAESAFIHHVLEYASIRPFNKNERVTLVHRGLRCPYKYNCIL